MSLSRQWLLGFLEANSTFSIVIKKSTNKVGYQATADFTVKLPLNEEATLRKVWKALDTGRFYTTKREAIIKATKLSDVRKLAKLFRPMKFVSENKRTEFERWCDCVGMIESGKHLKKEGFLKIVLMRDMMHRGSWNKKSFCDVRAHVDPCKVYREKGKLPTNCKICHDIHEKHRHVDVKIEEITGNAVEEEDG